MSDDKTIPLSPRSRISSVLGATFFLVAVVAAVMAAWFLGPIVRDLWRGSGWWALVFWSAFVVIMIAVLWRVRKRSLARWDPSNAETQALVMPTWARRILPVCEISVAAGAGVVSTVSIANVDELLPLYVVAMLTCAVMGALGWFIKWWAELDGWKSNDAA